jgi:Ca2+-binding RTX toxin-like protein
MRERYLPIFWGSAAIFAAGCGGSGDSTSVDGISPDDPFATLLQDLTPLVNQCQYVSSARQLTVTLAANETALIKRVAGSNAPVDDTVTVNGFDCNVVVPAGTGNSPVTRVVVNGTSGAETVILDFSEGPFALGTNATNGIIVDLSTSTSDTIGIRLSSLDDIVTFGTSGVAIVNSSSASDLFREITPRNIEFHKIMLGAGNDTINASGSTASGIGAFTTLGTLEIYGGDGDDIFNEGNAKTRGEVISGGNGTDTLSYTARTAALTMTITAADALSRNDGDQSSSAGNPPENDDIKDDVDVIISGPGNDNIAGGGTQGVTLFGAAGNDTLAGGLGNDSIVGGLGNDRFFEGNDGTNGADVFVGSDGIDVIDYSGRSGGTIVNLDGTANDGEGGTEQDDIGIDIENIIGGQANDTLTGSARNNVIIGGPGNDSIHGGAGFDTLSYGPVNGDVVAQLPIGTDTADFLGGNGVGTDSELDVIFGDIENLTGGSGLDSLTGNSGPNELVGGGGADTLLGLGGDDVLEGGAAGNAESNELYCGPGDDVGYSQGSGGAALKNSCEF